MTAWLTLLKWLRNIPVLFAHFPGPTLALVVIAIGCASAVSSCATHKLEAGARADLRALLAEARAQYADERTAAASTRADTIQEAAREQAAINAANVEWMRAAMQAFMATKDASAPALVALGKKIEELHNDAKYACRREPLPVPYTDGLRIPAGPLPAAPPAETRGH